MDLFLLLLLLSLLGSAEGFVARLPLTRRSCRDLPGGAAVGEDGIIMLNSGVGESLYPGDEAPLLAINETLRVDVNTLAERKQPPSPYQITRPRWYSKKEVAIIVLLCQRLRMLDLKGVERMLDAQKSFSKEDPVSLLVLDRVFCRMDMWTQLLLHVDGNSSHYCSTSGHVLLGECGVISLSLRILFPTAVLSVYFFRTLSPRVLVLQRDVWERALFLKAAVPEANFRTVIQRHPRVSKNTPIVS